MIQSLFVYSFMMFFLIITSIYISKTSIGNNSGGEIPLRFYRMSVFVCCSVFAIVFGARYDTGVDHLSYLSMYQKALEGLVLRDDLEPGFVLITNCFAFFDLHFFFYFSFFAFVQIFCLFYAFKEEQYLYPFLFFILMTSFFMPFMNVIRQNIVFCIFLCAIRLIQQKKFLIYVLIIVVSTYFFHKSAILLILVYPIFRIKSDYTINPFLQIVLYLLVIYLNRNNFLDAYIDKIIYLAGFSQYSDKYADIVDHFYREYNFGPRVILVVVINIFTFLLSHKLKQFYQDTQFGLIYTLFFYGSCLWMLCYGNYLLQRPLEYFYYMALPIYSYTLYYLWTKSLKNYVSLTTFIVYLLLQIAVFCGTIYSTTEPEAHTAFNFFWQ